MSIEKDHTLITEEQKEKVRLYSVDILKKKEDAFSKAIFDFCMKEDNYIISMGLKGLSLFSICTLNANFTKFMHSNPVNVAKGEYEHYINNDFLAFLKEKGVLHD